MPAIVLPTACWMRRLVLSERLITELPDLLVIDKPANISLLADRSGAANLWDMLVGELGPSRRPYLVHRLDKGTSGVLLVATTQERQRHLTKAFEARLVRKYYVARLADTADLQLSGTGRIDLPLRKGRKSRYRVAGRREDIERTGSNWRLAATAVDPQGKPSHPSATRWRHLGGERALLQPLTGRTHQLRVHLSWLGWPLRGDHLYGRPDQPAQQWPRLALHCHRLIVPGVGSFRASAPQEFLT